MKRKSKLIKGTYDLSPHVEIPTKHFLIFGFSPQSLNLNLYCADMMTEWENIAAKGEKEEKEEEQQENKGEGRGRKKTKNRMRRKKEGHEMEENYRDWRKKTRTGGGGKRQEELEQEEDDNKR